MSFELLLTTKLTYRYEAQRNSGRVARIPRSWRGSALLGFVVMSHGYDYFSLGVSTFKIPDS
ncbi:MAG: hypothetical protein J4N73_11915, partial [Chloroflexi bacterium]|nr:hypothetical protein [Chloroflexota bacterium]